MTNEEISLKTKKNLAGALKKALRKKKLSKITVRELAEACDINRKTFYYHFTDVYDLLKWMLEDEAIDVVNSFNFISDTEGAVRFVMDYAEANRDMISSIYDSMGGEELRRIFYNDLTGVAVKVIDQAERELGLHLDEEFKTFLAAFYAEACSGLLIEWVRNWFDRDKETLLKYVLTIFKVSIPAIMREKAKETGANP